ncbi:MAG: hypothetical protein WA419_17810 [Silvibacterium sp.]
MRRGRDRRKPEAGTTRTAIRNLKREKRGEVGAALLIVTAPVKITLTRLASAAGPWKLKGYDQ